jgi:hypothetical protein
MSRRNDRISISAPVAVPFALATLLFVATIVVVSINV